MKLFKKIKFEMKAPSQEAIIEKEKNLKIIEEVKESKDENPVVTEDENKSSLKSTLKEVNEKLDVLTKRDKKKEQKEFRLPSKIKRQLKKLALKNKVLVLYLTRNRGMVPMISEIRDGFVSINNMPYNCSTDFVFLWKGKYPAMVISEWDIRPIGTADYYDAVANKTIADPIAIAIRMIENKENIMKNKVSPKVWIFVGLGVIAFLWILFGGGK